MTALGPPPVAQVAPIPRVLQIHQTMEPIHHQQLTPIVDAHGTLMLDSATGHPLVAAAPAAVQQQVQYVAGADGGVYTVQSGLAPHLQLLAQVPAALTQQQLAQQHQHQQQIMVQSGNQQVILQQSHPVPSEQTPLQTTEQDWFQSVTTDVHGREINHDLIPGIIIKSLSALKDRKEEILSELGDIVGTTAASAIGNMASLQVATTYTSPPETESTEDIRLEGPADLASGFVTDQPQAADSGTYGIWTSRPLVTLSVLTAMAGSRHGMQTKSLEVEPLPEGICVSRFGPISRRSVQCKNYSEPTAVTAGFGLHTRSTTSLRQPHAMTSTADKLMMLQDHHAVLQFPDTASVYEFDPGYYTDCVHSNIREGMESVSMSHLVNPPYTPISPLPDPRDQTASSVRLNSQSLTMAAESARIQKELSDLQRRISCLTVAENSNQMAFKRDRLAVELRMIEGGIRDRHKEINQNLFYPHAESEEEVQTEYTYW